MEKSIASPTQSIDDYLEGYTDWLDRGLTEPFDSVRHVVSWLIEGVDMGHLSPVNDLSELTWAIARAME